MPNIIEATIIIGKAEDVIPRNLIIISDLPFQFKHLQFPVHFSFAMNINKVQGQSSKVVRLKLLKPCFSHIQLCGLFNSWKSQQSLNLCSKWKDIECNTSRNSLFVFEYIFVISLITNYMYTIY